MKTLASLLVAFSFFSMSCSMVRVVNPSTGEKNTMISFMENTDDEERILGPDGSYHERKIGKDQVSGGKVVARSILGAIIAYGAFNTWQDHIAADAATESAKITAKTTEAQIAADTELGIQELSNELETAKLFAE